MSIQTPAQLQSLLESRGYDARVTEASVLAAVGTAEARHVAAFSFKNGLLSITCQIALLGDFAENKIAQLSLAALDANMQISPYAFAIIGAAEGELDLKHCPLVLTDTLPTSDLSAAEIDFALTKLHEAIAHSHELLHLGTHA